MTTTASADLRSPSARALDETLQYLQGRVPDRFPPGFHPLMGTKSMASEVAGELARRARARFGHSRAFHEGRLGDDLEKLRKILLEHDLDAGKLQHLREAIDAKLRDLEKSLEPKSAPDHWTALARDLGLVLGLDVEGPNGAEAKLDAALVSRNLNFGDRRHLPILQRFHARAISRSAPDAEAKLLRRLLVGHGLPAVRSDDRSWMPKAPTPYQPRPLPANVQLDAFAASTWFESIMDDVTGGARPRPESEQELRVEVARRNDEANRAQRAAENARAKLPQRGATIAQMAAVAAAAEAEDINEARRKIDVWAGVERANIAKRYLARVDALRIAIVRAIDRTLASIEPGPAWWWAREVRRHLALDPGDPGLFETGVDGARQLIAWSVFRTYAVELDLQPDLEDTKGHRPKRGS